MLASFKTSCCKGYRFILTNQKCPFARTSLFKRQRKFANVSHLTNGLLEMFHSMPNGVQSTHFLVKIKLCTKSLAAKTLQTDKHTGLAVVPDA